MTPIAICVPARDEVTELPNLFAALDRLEYDNPSDIHVCLLLDGCQDDSFALAAVYRSRSSFQVWIQQVPRTTENAGLARHRAMMLGMRAIGESDGLLLTTDADSSPAGNWLRSMSAGLRQAELVAGKIERHGELPNPLQDRVETYYDALFTLRRRLDPVPWEAAVTHHHASGANIGVHAKAYRALGGFAAIPCGEDALLLDDAARAGLRVRRDAASLVYTSGRRVGRAAGGLASSLRQLDRADPGIITVAHPADVAWQYRMHSEARSAYALSRFDSIGSAIGLSHDHVRGVARDCVNSEAFAMRVVPEPPGGMRGVALPFAERELLQLTAAHRAA